MSGIVLTVSEWSGKCQGKILSRKNVPEPFNNTIYLILNQEVLATV